MKKGWDEETIKKVAEMRAKGLSYKAIGEALGGLSRNVVAGLCFRNNITLNRKKKEPKVKKESFDVSNDFRISKGITLMELKETSCRNVHKDKTYCGKPIAKGSYCQHHAALFLLPKKDPK